MFCARCGKEIPQGVSFCPNCGMQVARNTLSQPQQSAPQGFNNPAEKAVQDAAGAVNNAQQTAAGNLQQSMNNAAAGAQQTANPYVGQPYGTQNYGQRPGPNAGGYTGQSYGQAPQSGYQQPGYQQPQQGGYQQMGYQPGGYQPQGFNVPEQKKSKKGLMIGIIAAAVIALAAILLFVWPGFLSGGSAAGSPEKTIKNFGTALQKLDFKAMIKCFDPESQKKLEGSIDNLGDLNMGGFDLSSLVEMMNLKVEMNVTNVDYNSDKTTCVAQVHMKMSYSFMGYSDTNEEDAPIEMVKTGGNWYIDGSSMDLEDFLGDIMGGIN